MNGTEMFEMQPFAGEFTEAEADLFEFADEAFEEEEEETRGRGFAPRGGRARAPIGARRPRPPAGGRRPRPPVGARRLGPPKPWPRPPRPRWPARGWPPAVGYSPLPTIPLVEPGGGAVGGASWSDAQLRCVRQCLGTAGDMGAAAAPAPATDQPDTAPPAQDEPAAGNGVEGELGGVIGPSGGAIGEVPLPAAIADPRSAGPGIYTLFRGGQRLYVGRSNHLRRRLQQHLWCLTHLGVGAASYTVKLTPMRGASPAQLKRVEAAVINRYGRQAQGGALRNVKARELEQELFEGA